MAKFRTVLDWLVCIGTAITIVADAGQRIASKVDATAKASK